MTTVVNTVIVNDDVCVGCGACVEVCPPDVLRMSETGKAAPAYPDDCQGCFICAMACAFDAIEVTVRMDEPTRQAFRSWQPELAPGNGD
jgi:NAD-dependent dihydropyrimidine dehydrogenase PreA subunit